MGWRTAETGIQSNSGVSETKEAKTTSELSSAIDASTSDISEAKDESTKQSVTSVLAEISGAGNAANVLDTDCDAKKKLGEFPPQESLGTEARGGETLADCFKQDIIPSEIASQSATSKSIELVSQTDRS